MVNYTTDDLVTFSSFLTTFYNVANERHRENVKYTNEQVFEELNKAFEDKYGEPRFPSYNAFRIKRDRTLRNGRKKVK